MSSRERFLAACAQQPPKIDSGSALLHIPGDMQELQDMPPNARLVGLDKVCAALAEFPVLFGGRPLDFTEFFMK